MPAHRKHEVLHNEQCCKKTTTQKGLVNITNCLLGSQTFFRTCIQHTQCLEKDVYNQTWHNVQCAHYIHKHTDHKCLRTCTDLAEFLPLLPSAELRARQTDNSTTFGIVKRQDVLKLMLTLLTAQNKYTHTPSHICARTHTPTNLHNTHTNAHDYKEWYYCICRSMYVINMSNCNA